MPPEKPVAKDEKTGSMRDDFDAAIKAIENDEEGAFTVETELDNAPTPEEIKLEKSEKAEAETKVEAEAKEILGKEPGDEKSAKSADDEKRDAETDKDAEGIVKAPESWSPAAREEWKSVPLAVQKQISKRETEINKALMDGSDNRKTGERFTDIANRYAQVIAAEGITDPVAGFEGLMQIMSVLRMGTPQQKAQKVADFIKGYQVPIGALDDLLAGEMPGGSADDPVAKLIDERMMPVNKLLAQLQQNENNRLTVSNNEAVTSVQTFKQDKANEFYEDVRMDMADLIDVSKKRQYDMPLQEAYDKACVMNSEVNAIIVKRAADAKLLNGKEELAAKKEAASSIIGKQIGDGTGSTDQSIRGKLTEVWDAQEAG